MLILHFYGRLTVRYKDCLLSAIKNGFNVLNLPLVLTLIHAINVQALILLLCGIFTYHKFPLTGI